MAADRIQRLLRLISVLQRDEPNTTATLMRELRVGRRTLFRDLQTLKEAGVPYHHDRARGYLIDKAFYLPPINLTVPETLGLMMLGKSAATQRDRPMVEAALSAIYKIIGTVPDPIRQVCADLMTNVSVAPDAQTIGNKETRYHTVLQRCIDQGRSCRIVYRSPVEGEDLHALLNPYLLHYVNRAWYVLGYTDAHQEVRMFKLVRLVRLEPTDLPFDRPANYHIEDKLGNAWQLIPEGKTYKVVLEFSRRVATNVSEVRWHKSQQHEVLEDGRCRITFEVDGINEIAWWVCGYADQVTVIKPPELRDKVEQMLRSALKQYAGQEPVAVVTTGHRPVTKPKNKRSPE